VEHRLGEYDDIALTVLMVLLREDGNEGRLPGWMDGAALSIWMDRGAVSATL
jgi:hypothetical protein